MLHLLDTKRTYDPETVAVMTAAFDTVCQSVSTRLVGHDDVRRRLALIILRYVDQGERDPALLSQLAFREWTGT